MNFINRLIQQWIYGYENVVENCQKIFCTDNLNKHYLYQGLIQTKFHTSLTGMGAQNVAPKN